MKRRVMTAVLAGALLLTGCGAGGSSDDKSSSKEGKSLDGGPPPAPEIAPDQPKGSAEDDGQRDFAPAPDMLSTFALDVDTASYGYARRTIGEGRLPEPSTVRPEEFVNSFRQDYSEPAGDGFSVHTDGARAGDSEWTMLRVGLATRSANNTYGEERRAPAALTFVLDISGSMAEPGRLDLAKESLNLTIDELRPDDSLSLVTFSDEASTVLPMTRIGSEGNREQMHAAVERLAPTDSTNVEAGVQRAYDEAVAGRRAGATNRVVLISDALANTGATSAEAILDRISDARQEHGITLFGVGVGSEYGDALMEQLTNRGDGHTSYVADIAAARKVFVEQLPRNIELRARDAKAQVAFDADAVEEFRLIGYENRAVADEDFRNDAVDGGEVGPGHTVTALYAVRLKEGASGNVATATVRWLDPKTRAAREESNSVSASSLSGPLWDSAPERLQVAALAAYFADALRAGGGQPLPGAPTIESMSGRAANLAEITEDPQVRELAETVDAAVRLV